MKREPLWRYLSLISEIGLLIAISTIGGLLIGIWLDGRLNTKGIFSIIFLLLGLSGGLLGCYRLLKETEEKNE